MQTHKLADLPLVFRGSDYWGPLVDFLRDRLAAEETIDPADLHRIRLTDSAESAVAFITDTAVSQFALTYGARPRRRWYLWE